MNPFETVTKAQARLLRSAAWQILVVAIALIGFSIFQSYPVPCLAIGAFLVVIALPPLLLVGSPRRSSLAFVYPLAAFALAAPWWLGGVRHPLVLLPIVSLHVAAFLLGVRQALWLSFAAIANLAAIAFCENRGVIHGSVPDSGMLVLFISGMAIHGLFFISTPLDVVRQLLSSAERDLSDRKINELALIELTDSLESNVARRTNELVLKRHLLQQSVDEVAASMGARIAHLQTAAHRLAATFPDGGGESRWMASRIASGCERMETIHTALHRFCKLGEESLKLKFLPAQAHTEMVHRVWNEVKILHSDRTISLFLDSIPGCLCDADLLQQVWQNLFSNAIHSTACTANAAVHVYHREGEFCVEDNGAGFDDVHAATMLGMSSRQGDTNDFSVEGIGLAISKRIVEMHGGQLLAQGIPDKGAIFRFSLRTEPSSESSD